MEHGCVLECVYISRNIDEHRKLRGNKKTITKRIENQYKELYGKELPKDYSGEPMEATLSECSKKYNILYRVFTIKDSKTPTKERIYEQLVSFYPPGLEAAATAPDEDENEALTPKNIED
jgi:16S rRNA C967 or C1407 C5-methylase (RsmB/RsmF family)